MKVSTVRVRNKKKNKIFTIDAYAYANSPMFSSDNYEVVGRELHDGTPIEAREQEVAGEAQETGKNEETGEEVVNDGVSSSSDEKVQEQPVRRGRGRPRKNV